LRKDRYIFQKDTSDDWEPCPQYTAALGNCPELVRVENCKCQIPYILALAYRKLLIYFSSILVLHYYSIDYLNRFILHLLPKHRIQITSIYVYLLLYDRLLYIWNIYNHKTVSLSCLTLTLKSLLLSLNTFDLRSLSTGFALVGLAPLGFG
jgi:hypothetical protein